MMKEWLSRTALLYGEEAVEKLASCRVAVFGIGGVGGYAVEALARSGLGALDLIDHDRVSVSNINRQIIATTRNIGQFKTDAAADRIAGINPECKVRTYRLFFLPETRDEFDLSVYDYVVDAIDTVSGKLAIIESATLAGVPVISSMGAGNKTDPAAFEVADIYKTSVCPLAKVMRRECRKRGIRSLKVVYSREIPADMTEEQPLSAEPARTDGGSGRVKRVPGSNAFVPAAAGLILAGEVVKDLMGRQSKMGDRLSYVHSGEEVPV